jgi:hypothetical protein
MQHAERRRPVFAAYAKGGRRLGVGLQVIHPTSFNILVPEKVSLVLDGRFPAVPSVVRTPCMHACRDGARCSGNSKELKQCQAAAGFACMQDPSSVTPAAAGVPMHACHMPA